VYTRRKFLGAIGLPAVAAAAGVPLTPLRLSRAAEIADELRKHPGSPSEVAQDEDFWFEVAQAFTVDRSLINLNNGGVSPSPAWVQEAMKQHLDYSNKAPVYTMWRILEPQRETVREGLAREWGVDPEEVALTRNASESLQICQFGYDLQRGDEVLTTTQDYGRMLTTFKQRERREGIVLKQFSIPVPSDDPADIVRRFEENITPRTRLILMCHMINLTGQILPVRDVVAMARRRGIPVIVDGAHSLAHHDFKISDLESACTSGSSRRTAPGCSTCDATRSKRSGHSWRRPSRRMMISASSRRSARTRRRTTWPSPRPSRSIRASAGRARKPAWSI
jgi:DNA-binding transcriptional MocR family regulator